MGLYLITYDLRQPGRNYTTLHTLLGTTWKAKKIAESVWLANLKGPAPDVRNLIQHQIDHNDRVVVIELFKGADWATSFGLKPGTDWLKAFVRPSA